MMCDLVKMLTFQNWSPRKQKKLTLISKYVALSLSSTPRGSNVALATVDKSSIYHECGEPDYSRQHDGFHDPSTENPIYDNPNICKPEVSVFIQIAETKQSIPLSDCFSCINHYKI